MLIVMQQVESMDVDAVDGGNSTTLDVLSENCSTHGCSLFCTSEVSPRFPMRKSKM